MEKNNKNIIKDNIISQNIETLQYNLLKLKYYSKVVVNIVNYSAIINDNVLIQLGKSEVGKKVFVIISFFGTTSAFTTAKFSIKDDVKKIRDDIVSYNNINNNKIFYISDFENVNNLSLTIEPSDCNKPIKIENIFIVYFG